MVKALDCGSKGLGSSPTCSRDLFLFRVYSALPQKLSRRFTFVSFGRDIKPSVLGNPLKLAYVSAIGSFLVNWIIPSKPTYITVSLFLHSLTPTTLYLSLATRYLHSLSRSTKLLHTSIVNVEVWRLVLEMLSLRDEEYLQVASEVACNLLLAFSPSREVKHWCFIFTSACSIFTCTRVCGAWLKKWHLYLMSQTKILLIHYKGCHQNS